MLLHFVNTFFSAGEDPVGVCHRAGFHGGGVRWEQGPLPPDQAAAEALAVCGHHREGPVSGQLSGGGWTSGGAGAGGGG